MKKSFIYLLLIAFTLAIGFISCNNNETKNSVAQELAIDEMQPYINNDVTEQELSYDIIDTKGGGLEIVFSDMTSKQVEDIYYLIETPLEQEGLRIDLINKNLYELIAEKEALFRHNEYELNYYKQGTDGIIYRKLIVYKQPDISPKDIT